MNNNSRHVQSAASQTEGARAHAAGHDVNDQSVNVYGIDLTTHSMLAPAAMEQLHHGKFKSEQQVEELQRQLDATRNEVAALQAEAKTRQSKILDLGFTNGGLKALSVGLFVMVLFLAFELLKPHHAPKAATVASAESSSNAALAQLPALTVMQCNPSAFVARLAYWKSDTDPKAVHDTQSRARSRMEAAKVPVLSAQLSELADVCHGAKTGIQHTSGLVSWIGPFPSAPAATNYCTVIQRPEDPSRDCIPYPETP